jgi:nitrogen fixation NifU-like protein
MKIGNNVIKDIKFSGEGCAISTSSIDIMSNYLKNKKIDDGLKLINNYLDMVYGKNVNKDTIGDLISFENIYKQVNRIKCASIGIEGMKKIIIEISKKNKRNKN